MYDEPLSAGEFLSSATNSPPNSYSRIEILRTVVPLLDNPCPDLRKIRKHMRRAIDAGKSSLYNAELAEMSLTRALSHKTPGKKPVSKTMGKGSYKEPPFHRFQVIGLYSVGVRKKMSRSFVLGERTQ